MVRSERFQSVSDIQHFRNLGRRIEYIGYENFLPEASFPVIRVSVNGEAAGAPFFLFFSALGFFFSRLLLNWLFATLFPLCLL
jgi:hypothetical protein